MKAQRVAFAWAHQIYGAITHKRRYQAFRFTEEALELAQASGLSQEDVLRVVHHVYGRPQGDMRVEIGDVRLCTDILAESQGLDSDQCYDDCLTRVMALDPEKARAKDRMKQEKGLV